MLHRHPNTPAHLFIDDAPYFITGAIYQKRKLLQNVALKQVLLDKNALTPDISAGRWSIG